MVKQSLEVKLAKFQKRFQKLTEGPFKKGYFDGVEYAYHCMSVNYSSYQLNNDIVVYYNAEAYIIMLLLKVLYTIKRKHRNDICPM